MADDPHNVSKAAAEWSSLIALSPLVIGARLTQFWLGAAQPTARDRNEAQRMIVEKMMAAGESMVAMNAAVFNACVSATTAMMMGKPRNVDDADAILTAGLRPYTKRLRDNRRRLSRRDGA